ncbi:HAD family hydrolase [bacterium]|nr:MAG: HAD family hydrolase [bacterium]
MPALNAVLFDLDGTLTDPKPGICGCIAHALQVLGYDAPHHNDLEWCIGPPLAGSFARLLSTDDAAAVSRAMVLYRERFSAVGLFENQVYDGIPDCLARLRQAGIKLYVATSKPHVLAQRILDRFELAPYFEAVYGSELDGTRVDKGEVIDHALSSGGLHGEPVLMVGDREHDVIGAHKCGLPCIGVTYGYGSAQELTSAGASSLIDSPTALADAILTFA